MSEIFIALLHMLATADTYKVIAINVAQDIIIHQLKSLCTKIIEKMSKYLAKEVIQIGGKIGTKVLVSGFRSLAVHVALNTAMRIGAKFAICSAKILSSALSIIGWITTATSILDILLSFWDPLNYNKMFPPEFPNDMMESAELSLRQMLQVAQTTYTFDHFANIILNEEEFLEIYMDSLVERLIYLDALVVNSEGSRIDKGEQFDPAAGSEQQMEQAQNAGMVQRVKFDPATYARYNEKFMTRVEANKLLNATSIISIILSGIFASVRMSIISFVFLIIGVIMMTIAKFQLYDDTLTNLLEIYKQKQYNI